MNKESKKFYITPRTWEVMPLPNDDMMTTGMLNVGGSKGGFDVKEEMDWEDEEYESTPMPSIELKNVWEQNW